MFRPFWRPARQETIILDRDLAVRAMTHLYRSAIRGDDCGFKRTSHEIALALGKALGPGEVEE